MASAYGADVPSIKFEAGTPMNGQLQRIKPDPDSVAVSPATQVDEDIYEDAGDLDFTGAEQGVYLTRLPKFLWESWSQLDDGQEIQVGTIRVEGAPGDIKRMSMMLAPDIARRKNVPKEYNMHVTNQDSINTFIFSEKDLPGYRQFSHDRVPPHFMERKRIEKNRKQQQSNFRRAIPKQTSLAGQIRTELNCLPVENVEYQRIMDERTRLALRPKRETQVVEGIVAGAGGSILNPGTLGTGDFRSFINRTGVTRGKRQVYKAARMPQNELLDLIYDCFKEYTYWPLRSLKDRLNQPETYLKETLEMVAMMIRSGPHAMQWQLKPEAREGRYAEAGLFDKAKQEAAPDVGLGMDFEDAGILEEDDDNVEMEDVPME